MRPGRTAERRGTASARGSRALQRRRLQISDKRRRWAIILPSVRLVDGYPRGHMPTSYAELQLAFDFVSSGDLLGNQAYPATDSGKIYWRFDDLEEELPEDIESEKYIQIPNRKEL